MIEYESFFTGEKRIINKDKITFRPSVYAVIKHKDKVLLIHTRGVYFMPGGHVDIGEKIEDALKREIIEETGLKIRVEKFINFYEKFTYHDKKNEAHHKLMFFYLCSPVDHKLSDGYVDDGHKAIPEWINISDINNIRTVGLISKVIKLI